MAPSAFNFGHATVYPEYVADSFAVTVVEADGAQIFAAVSPVLVASQHALPAVAQSSVFEHTAKLTVLPAYVIPIVPTMASNESFIFFICGFL